MKRQYIQLVVLINTGKKATMLEDASSERLAVQGGPSEAEGYVQGQVVAVRRARAAHAHVGVRLGELQMYVLLTAASQPAWYIIRLQFGANTMEGFSSPSP